MSAPRKGEPGYEEHREASNARERERRADVVYRERDNARQRAYRRAHPIVVRARKRQAKTGWTPEQFEAAWREQGGKCAICFCAMLKVGKSALSVAADHDHTTGRPRALLCTACNKGLGFFADDPANLGRAMAYVFSFRLGE